MAILLPQWSVTAPDAAIVGVIGEEGGGAEDLLRSAAGRRLGPEDSLDFSPAPALVIDHAFARRDAVARARASIALEQLRRGGCAILLASHEEDLLRALCDEIWWLEGGKIVQRGDPSEVLAAYNRHVAAKVRAWGSDFSSARLDPRWRRGDGRAEIESIDLEGEDHRPTQVWTSGEQAFIRLTIRFREAVPDPVAGILIRTRVGLNVYGTNTELERLALGPCEAGSRLCVTFAFRCDLCPQEYTLTAASHDPDGVWHDWIEDAVAFTVTDSRYTAGVANLRARVSYCLESTSFNRVG
jgi:lipopolysaccharide transport system ATP-binding protein